MAESKRVQRRRFLKDELGSDLAGSNLAGSNLAGRSEALEA